MEKIKAKGNNKMLERLEFCMPEERYGGDYCPICDNGSIEGHKPDCELVALLKESEVEGR